MDINLVPHKAFSEMAAAVDNRFSEMLEHEDIPICLITEEDIHLQAEYMREFICRYIDEKEKMQIAFIKSLSDVIQ